jgi:hypothetical protein
VEVGDVGCGVSFELCGELGFEGVRGFEFVGVDCA